MTEENENAFFFTPDSKLKNLGISGEGFFSPEEGMSFSVPFLIEFVSQVKKSIASIRAYNGLSKGRFNDERFGEYFNKKMAESLGNLDAMIDSLLDYMKVNTPIQKVNTLHNIIEEVLDLEKLKLEEKKIKIFKKFEEGLPETTFHDEHLKYIFHSIVQFAIPLIPVGGNFGFLTRSISGPKEKTAEKVSYLESKEFVETLVLISGYKKPGESVEVALGIPGISKDDLGDLILRLVRETLRKNCGEMKLELDEKEARTLITLRLPIERRKLFFYQPAKA